jgi:hypothetical protein
MLMDSDPAERHRSAAATHDDAAERHETAADEWAARGDDKKADLERRSAEIERMAAQLERDRAALESETKIARAVAILRGTTYDYRVEATIDVANLYGPDVLVAALEQLDAEIRPQLAAEDGS